MKSSDSKEVNMEPIYRYLRHPVTKEPMVTICLVTDGENIGRGITLYKKEKSWILSKKWGKDRARMLADKALTVKRNIGILTDRANGDPKPINFESILERVKKKFTKDKTKYNAIELAILNGLGTMESHKEGEHPGIKLRIYRGSFNPSLTNFETSSIRKEWKVEA
jgi:hypothetical protein